MRCLSLKEYNFKCNICEEHVSEGKGGYNFSKEGRALYAVFICHRCFSEMKHSAEILKLKSDNNNNC